MRAQISALDPEDDSYDSELARLRVQLHELRDMKPKPAKVERKESGLTVGQMWRPLDDMGKRRYLLKQGLRYVVHRDEDGYISLLSGDAERLEAGEWHETIGSLAHWRA